MRNNRPKSLKVVLNIAKQSEQQAAQELQVQRQQLEAQRQQLREITDYNHEYSDQIDQLGAHNIFQVASQRQFLGQLGDLIRAQSETVGVLAQQTEKAESHWQSKYYWRKKVAEMVERIEREENSARQKQLQKELDELASLITQNPVIH